jgi:hypothetical protein
VSPKKNATREARRLVREDYLDKTVRLALQLDACWGMYAKVARDEIERRLQRGISGLTARDFKEVAIMLEHAGTQAEAEAERLERLGRLTEKQVGDTLYTFTPAFREGARALWASVPYTCNPYRAGSQRAQDWEDGHCLADDRAITKEEVGPK